MKFWYDTEFLDDGRIIELVSIGIVSEDGREYYAVNGDVRWERVARKDFLWVRENVWPHLPLSGIGQLAINRYSPDVKSKATIAREVEVFLLGDTSDGQAPDIELWAYYSAYDHVALCQLWGPMADLPEGIPWRTNDISQLTESLGISAKQLPRQDPRTEHHALYDAKHNRRVFNEIHGAPFRERYSGAWGKAPA